MYMYKELRESDTRKYRNIKQRPDFFLNFVGSSVLLLVGFNNFNKIMNV